MSSPKQTKTTAPPASQVAATPSSPTSRRLSLGGGNDGAGGQIYKGLQKKRTNSLEQNALYSDQSKSPLYEKFKAFVKGGGEKP